MFAVQDKVRVKTTGAVGKVIELRGAEEVCVEFDGCAGTQTCFGLSELELIRPEGDVSMNVDLIQADKGL